MTLETINELDLCIAPITRGLVYDGIWHYQRTLKTEKNRNKRRVLKRRLKKMNEMLSSMVNLRRELIQIKRKDFPNACVAQRQRQRT